MIVIELIDVIRGLFFETVSEVKTDPVGYVAVPIKVPTIFSVAARDARIADPDCSRVKAGLVRKAGLNQIVFCELILEGCIEG